MPIGTTNPSTVRPPDLQQEPVLCVDLDGTVLATDLLWETLLLLLKEKPWLLFVVPFWLLRGKAKFKHELACRITIDGSTLPYREDVIQYLRAERSRGRRIVLATASDQQVVKGVAAHLGLFSDVLSSDGNINLSGGNKERILIERFGAGGYDYIGNDAKDAPVWSSARSAIVVHAPNHVLRAAQRSFHVIKVFPRQSLFRPAVKSLRVYQWSKNLLVFVPVAMAHRVLEWERMSQVMIAFAVLSMCASGSYILNDLLDLPADRAHPIKKMRPFAAGSLPIPVGVVIMVSLIGTGIVAASILLPVQFTLLLALYLVTTTAYSVYIKTLVIADIIALAGLYTLRILAGGFAARVEISFWLLAFSMFIFLSLAFMKRYVELTLMAREGKAQSAGRAYRAGDLRILETMGTAAGFMSVAVLALFINSTEISKLYRRPQMLWLVCPALFYWIIRMWFRAQRGALDNDDPIVATFQDKVSYMIAALIACLVVLAT